MWTLMVAMLTAMPVPADTILGVEPGVRLEVENHRGDVVLDVWDRNAVRVVSDLGNRQRLEARRTGSVLRVRPGSVRGGPAAADLRITVPRWMDVRISGNQLDIVARGIGGELAVETVGGDVEIEGGAGRVDVRTIQGTIRIRDSRAAVRAISVNDDIELTRITGDVHAETTNGDITLRSIRAATVRATTVNGDVAYQGELRAGGRYGFSTHNGGVSVTVPADASATVAVSTYHGGFESDFPVRLTGSTRDRQFHFTLGSGRARVELESFNGSIRLRRP